MSAVVNSSFEFNCETECKLASNISWSYMPPASSAPQRTNLSLKTPACLTNGRCHTKDNTEMGGSLLNIDRVQFSDVGTYLCSAELNKSDYCEMSFNFTGNFLCIHRLHILTSSGKSLQERPAVADKPARRLRNVSTICVRAVGL